MTGLFQDGFEAKLVGDIKTSRIMIEDGAYFKGSIDISKGAQVQRPTPAQTNNPAVPATPVPAGINPSK